MTNRRAFTLIETLIAVMLTGTLTTLALAPTVRAVRATTDTMNSRSDAEALTRAANIIERDTMNAMRLSPVAMMINDHDSMGGLADDTLMLMSSSPSSQGMPGGTIVYKVVEDGITQSVIPGLYRFVIAGRRPNEVNPSRLEAQNGQLVLPDVAEFSAQIPGSGEDAEEEARKTYSGPLPPGLSIRIRRGTRSMSSSSAEDRGNDEIARTIAIP